MASSKDQLTVQFRDVKSILDQALRASGGTYTASTHGRAVQFRQRAYTFRKHYREALFPDASPYDALIIRRIGETDMAVRIELVSTEGTFVPDSEEGDEPFTLESDDPLVLEAMKIALKPGE